MTKDQLFKPEYAAVLLKIAEGDCESAEVLSQARKGRPENVCFAAQQSIAKAIKAVLCAKGQPLPFTHSTELLLDRLPNDLVPPLGQSLILLTDYATIRRYEEGHEILSEADLTAAVNAAKSTVEWAKTAIRS